MTRRACVPVLSCALMLTVTHDAFGDGAASPTAKRSASKVRCKASYESAQILKREERLAAARAQLAICRETCPAPLVAECASWASEIEALVPTIRLVARDVSGEPLTDVRVSIDGRHLTERIDAPIAVDPGVHVFRFESPRGAPVETRAEIHAGEREHLVTVVLGAPASPPSPTAPPEAAETRPSRAPSYVAFGAGAALFATAGVLALKGQHDRSELRSSCAPTCDQADVDAIERLWWAAAAFGAAGAVALGVGVWLWPSGSLRLPAASTRTSPVPAVGLTPRTVALVWRLP